MSKKILVTGGSGFLGSALVKRLVKEGEDVVVLDNGSRGNLKRLESIFEKITYIEGDIRDLKTVKTATYGCDTIFHLAFINGTRFFYEKPELVLDVGLKGAMNTIEAAREYNVGTYIMASSSEIYQEPTKIPTDEAERAIIPDVTNPRFSYAGGKLIGELLSINSFRGKETRDLIFRPHNVFGPDMGMEHVIPEIVMKLKIASKNWSKKIVDIEIEGTGYETRAFCYIEEAIDQIMLIYRLGKKGELYHVGVSDEIKIKDVIKKIGDLLDLDINLIYKDLKKGSTPRRCPDITKIKKLGYLENFSFSQGLREAVEWYKVLD